MSCKCHKCRNKLAETNSFHSKPRRIPEQVSVYGSGSNGYSHINTHAQIDRHRSGSVSPPHKSDVASSKLSSPESKSDVAGTKLSSPKPKPKSSNSAILETADEGLILVPGQVLRFNRGISGSDNNGSIVIGPTGDSITFKSAGMYRFVFTFAVEDSAPNSLYISMSKSNPDHINFQTLTVYTNGVNVCSTILPIKENTEVKFRHPGGKNKSDIKFVGPVRLELYEV